MNIAVGSQNPVKVEGIRAVASDVFESPTVEAVPVSSGVSEMPSGWGEASEGASNRAENCLEEGDYDIAVGPEGYVTELDGGMFLSNWVAVLGTDGIEGHAGGTLIELPGHVAARIREGEELGPLMDRMLGREETKKSEGTIGILTDGLYPRQKSFEDAFKCALSRYLQPGLYQGDGR